MTRLTAATALGVIFSTTPLMAEVTPQSVWEEISNYYERMGLVVEGGEMVEAADALTVRDVVISMEAPDSEMDWNVGEVVLTANGDNTVTVDLPDQSAGTMTMIVPASPDYDALGEDDMPMPAEDIDTMTEEDTAAGDDAASEDMAAPDTAEAAPETKTITVNFSVKTPGEELVISEEGEATVFGYVMPEVSVTVDSIVDPDGRTIENPASVTITDMRGSDRVETADMTRVAQTGSAAEMVVDINIDEEEGSAIGQFTMAGMEFTSETELPAGTTLGADFSEAMIAGLKLRGDSTIEKMDFALDFSSTEPDGETQQGSAAASSENLNAQFNMDAGNMGYGGTSGMITAELNIPDEMLAVGYSATSSEFDVMFPMAADPEPQDFSFDFALDGLELSDEVWAMFDPQAALPRDAAALNIDLDGQMTVAINLMDNEAMMQAMEAPMSLNSLKINNVDLSAVGVNLGLTGDIELPEGGPMPTPVGIISGRVEGLNALLDTLVSAGMVPQDQMMGMRMMMAMFVKQDPSDANVMTSEIEFRESGEILANGQRVK
ncbi:DUF2125 domain-containing protein [Paracoccus sp. SCSIO 75233]|uniref:DUF2125 domain-containing protein n=1 Tax=Paracoccus sp. SCSIO 75233 TaxID=3017782 RepID=UPI0022F11AAB|nr:DUF2125 domain-containing protein [Paracoccus sp. SCSIO 75233]WBU52937.1 DUF2125 domain-containing protein [Paracoccus sp. SCSIO 75233]